MTSAIVEALDAMAGAVGPFKRAHLAAATGAVANQFVTSTNMKVGAYTLANSGAMPTEGARKITVTHTAVTGNDTLGTIEVAGYDLAGQAITETITPAAGTVATGTKWFRSVTSVTGAGWVINSGNDTITVGCAAGVIVAEGDCVLHSVVVNTAAAGAVTISDVNGTIAVLKSSIVEGDYPYDVRCSGYLAVSAAAATDLTITFR